MSEHTDRDVTQFIERLGRPSPGERMAAAEGIGRIIPFASDERESAATSALVELLGDRDQDVVCTALFALARATHRAASAVPALTKLIGESQFAEVRARAQQALEWITEAPPRQ